MTDGACTDIGPDLFFPEGAGGGQSGTAVTAKQICKSCPVRLQCLEYAIANREQYGVWGGAAPRDRRKIAAQRARRNRLMGAA
jgi:WhiB family redox-sensing transcriptional regulator